MCVGGKKGSVPCGCRNEFDLFIDTLLAADDANCKLIKWRIDNAYVGTVFRVGGSSLSL